MRLDFNMVVVDDDFLDEDDRQGIDELIQKLKTKVASKGFELNESCFSTIDDAIKNTKPQNRVDLFLSDNNLGNNPNHVDEKLSNGGIDYYLGLRKQQYICDFVLYTRADKDEIVNKLSEDLNKTRDPNLFTRFTFVNRDETDAWHTKIVNLFDHLLTKREELNNIRGIYAQNVSKIHEYLINKYKLRKNTELQDSIKRIPRNAISPSDRDKLHQIRKVRNGLLHNDEEFCPIKNEYVIRWKKDGYTYEIYEGNLQHYRDLLKSAVDVVTKL